jgi:hypothetical protein
MIYVIRTIGKPAYIKVGYSKKYVHERINDIKTSCPFRLEILSIKEGTAKEEKELHEKLADFWIRGEWFRSCDESLGILGIDPKQKPTREKDFKRSVSPYRVRAYINNKFKYRDPPQDPVATPLEFLCRERGYDKEVVLKLEKEERAEFFIVRATSEHIMKSLGAISGDDEGLEVDDKGELDFIVPKRVFDRAKWQSITSELVGKAIGSTSLPESSPLTPHENYLSSQENADN